MKLSSVTLWRKPLEPTWVHMHLSVLPLWNVVKGCFLQLSLHRALSDKKKTESRYTFKDLRAVSLLLSSSPSC